jgi:hypothetical protein
MTKTPEIVFVAKYGTTFLFGSVTFVKHLQDICCISNNRVEVVVVVDVESLPCSCTPYRHPATLLSHMIWFNIKIVVNLYAHNRLPLFPMLHFNLID